MSDAGGVRGPARVLFLFLDGVGIGAADPDDNPFLRADLPALRGLLGGALPTLDEPVVEGSDAIAFPLDATLGVEGLPQSGTGQTALLTGENAPRRLGRHFGPWTPVRLRPLLEERSVLRRAQEGGRSVIFANAYPEGFVERVGSRRVAPVVLAAGAAGLLGRGPEALAEGRAVASEIVNEGWRRRLGFTELPRIEADEAGANLAALSGEADLTLYAHWATDQAGHYGEAREVVEALERVDRFLGGILEGLGDDTLLLVASDHGNVESAAPGHTRNPALGVLAGPGARERGDGLGAITDVAAALLAWLGIESERPGDGAG